MSTLCVTTVVNERYQEFIPWFAYFINESYPAYHTSVFLTGKASKKVRRCLDLIGGNFILHENCFREYPTNDVMTIKCLRWTNYSDEFENFDYIYIGDIDMLVCREKPDLLLQHIQHCDLLGLPYSNKVRGTGAWQDKPRRLTGLHFVKRKEWYGAMRPIMKKYNELLRKKRIDHDQNEVVLHQMVAESVLGLPKGIDEVRDSAYRFRPHHGLHLRLWQRPNDNPKLQGFFPRTKDGWEIFAGSVYKQYFDQLKEMQQSAVYERLYRSLSEPRAMIHRMIKFYEHIGC